MQPAVEQIRQIPRREVMFRALRHRNFRLYVFGQAVSQTGSWMQIVAQGWLVYRLTNSPMLLGLVSFVGLLPVLPVSLLAGVISDKFSRRSVLLVTQSVLLLQSLCMAVLVWLGLIQIWHVIVLSFILGAANALEQPSRLAFIVDVVGREDLTNAIALNASAYNSARIIGPVIAGLLVGSIGEAGCFFINSISFLAVIIALLLMHLSPREIAGKDEQIMGSLVSGLKYIWDTVAVRDLLMIVGTASFLILPYLTLMPVFASDVLKSGPQVLGLLMTATGVGAIAGALVVAGIPEGRRGRWLMVANLIGPAFLLLFCLSRNLGLSLFLVALVSVFVAVRQTLSNGLIQLSTDQEYHGRVMSMFHLTFAGLSQAGTLAVGALAEFTGTTLAVGVSAAVCLIAALAMLWRMPVIRKLR